MTTEKKMTTCGAAAHRGAEAAPPPLQSQPTKPAGSRFDDDIVQEVRDCLAGMFDGGSRFEVEVRDGTVILRGRIFDAVVAKRAVDIAGRVRGVRSVTNQLAVELEQRAGDGRGPGRPASTI
jgi:osmotically-inducible protein OsmY